MELTNALERDILQRFADKYSYLQEHITFLSIKNRDYKGVGLYVNFVYECDVEKLPIDSATLSTDEIINVDGLDSAIFFELNITNGKIDFIEFVTCDKPWNGNFQNYSFESLEF